MIQKALAERCLFFRGSKSGGKRILDLAAGIAAFLARMVPIHKMKLKERAGFCGDNLSILFNREQ